MQRCGAMCQNSLTIISAGPTLNGRHTGSLTEFESPLLTCPWVRQRLLSSRILLRLRWRVSCSPPHLTGRSFFCTDRVCIGSQRACIGPERVCIGTERACIGTERACIGTERACIGSERTRLGPEWVCMGLERTCTGSGQACIGAGRPRLTSVRTALFESAVGAGPMAILPH